MLKEMRLIEVRFLGWPLIIVSLLEGIFYLDFRHCVSCSHAMPRHLVVASLAYAVIVSVLGIIAGWGLLKHKDGMRRMAIALSVANIAVGLTLFTNSSGDVKSYLYGTVDYVYSLGHMPVNAFALYGMLEAAAASLFWLIFFYRVFLVLYLTGAGARKQFSGQTYGGSTR